MNNQEKGNIGELMVLADLTKRGINSYKPINNACPFDILIELSGQYKRVQVKYRPIRNGSITTELLKCTINQGNKSKIERNNETDILAIYCPDTNKCYYVNSSEIDKTIVLRIEASKNNQTKGVRFAKDYENLPNLGT